MGYALYWACVYQVSALRTRLGPEVDQHVGCTHNLLVVLHHHHGIAEVAQTL